MQISELIAALQSIYDTNGNVPVSLAYRSDEFSSVWHKVDVSNLDIAKDVDNLNMVIIFGS